MIPHQRYYPTTSVQMSGEKWRWEFHHLPTPSDSHTHGSWVERKNLYALRNYIFPNLATVGTEETTRPASAWFLDPNSCLGNCTISLQVLVLGIISKF